VKAGLSNIGFARQTADPTDREVYDMIDDCLYQVLGAEGLRKIICPGDRVVLKVNMVGPYNGERGEKGRGIITDPRVARYVAGLVRDIIGFEESASLKVVDAVMYSDKNPSLKSEKSSFYWAKLERTGDNAVDEQDFCYDFDADGILDGGSQAELVNLDGIGPEGRQLFQVPIANGKTVNVSFPKFLRTREQALNSDSPDEYCDVLIGLPILKSHFFAGVTGALKLHYGIRSRFGMPGDPGRLGHSGMFYDEKGRHNNRKLVEYLCAMHLVRSYDLCIMDCITANRKGPRSPGGGVAYQPNIDQKTDYIIAGAMMASLDPVALDTAEAALAGYEQDSIPILSMAATYELGQNKPEHIRIVGGEFFSLHRQFLWHKYRKDCPFRYPLEDGWGGARVLKSVEPKYSVYVSTPRRIVDNVYGVIYRIQKNKESYHRRIVRVELIIGSALVDYKTGDHLEQGSFALDLNKHPELLKSDLIYYILAWDDTFNCVNSIERFIYG